LTTPDACTSATDWTNELRLTNNSFNMDLAPDAGGHFLGDYMALRSTGQTLGAVFGQATSLNKTSIYFRAVTLPTVTASGN
jgi:hypothetical protein